MPSNPALTPGHTSSPAKIQPSSKPSPNNSSSTTSWPIPSSSRSSTRSSPQNGSSAVSVASKPNSGITRSNASTKTSLGKNFSTPRSNTIPQSVTPTRTLSSPLLAFSGESIPQTACSSAPSKPSRTSRPPQHPNRLGRTLTRPFLNRNPPW